MQDLWQGNCQIWSIIFQNEFVRSNAIVTIEFLNMEVSMAVWLNISIYLVIKIIQTKLTKIKKAI